MQKFLVALTLGLTSIVSADFKQFYYERWTQDSAPPSWNRQARVEWFDQRIDHQNPKDLRTFRQRYFINDSYAQASNSPVLFYLCGEAACSDRNLTGAIATHAQKHRAHLVALEHRYYGLSQPFDRLTRENLEFLSTIHALEDAADFQKSLMTTHQWKGPWIAVGGSYPGSLAAYYRLKYPELVVGALSSSGPVQARDNFEEYDRHVAIVAGPQCLAQIKKVIAKVESVLESPMELTSLKKTFQSAELNDKLDFVYLIADMAALAIQYGYKERFCSLISSSDAVEGYAEFTREIFAQWGINALSMSAQGALNEDPKYYADGLGMRQWFYQSCTEYGYWQNAYHDETLSARSKLINPEFHLKLCKRLFDISSPVDTELINKLLYEPLLLPSVSRIFFTNGSQDPWINLSIAVENENASNPHTETMTIEGASHCDDLRRPKPSDSQALKNARERFSALAGKWVMEQTK